MTPTQNVEIFLNRPVLKPLGFNGSIFVLGNPQGTFIGNVLHTTTNSTVTFQNLNSAGALQLKKIGSGWVIQVGPTVPIISNFLTFNLVETLHGAINSPRVSHGFSITIITPPAPITIGWNPTVTPTASGGLGPGVLNASGGVASGGAILSSNATIQSISAYVVITDSPASHIILGIYDNTGAGGLPGNRIAFTVSTAVVAGWNTLPVITTVQMNAGTYWLLQVSDSATATFGRGPGTAGHYNITSAFAYTMPAVAPPFPSVNPEALAIYATFTTTSTPVNTVIPKVFGTAQVGQTLSTDNGSWTGNPTGFSWQWISSANGNPVVSTAATYIPAITDIGFALKVSVRATNINGTSISPGVSLLTSNVIDIIPTNTALPTIPNGSTAQVQVPLTATEGTWTHNPTSYINQWQSAGINASGQGATTLTYTPVVADIGHMLTINVNAVNSGGTSALVTSLPTSNVIRGGAFPVNSVIPKIFGAAQVGQTLSTDNGSWSNGPTSFAWSWNGVGPPTNAATYIPVNGDIGNTITVTVTAFNGSGPSDPVASMPTLAVVAAGNVPVNTAIPIISGSAQVGQTLTTDNGMWSSPSSPITSFAYQWKSAGVNVGTSINTYGPANSDIGNKITVTVTATNSTGPSVGAMSNPTLAVIAAGAVPVNTALPMIFGSAQVGQVLSTDNGMWSNGPIISYAYVWSGVGSPTNAATYTPVNGDIGNKIMVTVTATNSTGPSLGATSNPTLAVTAQPVPVNTVLPKITGTAQVNQQLSTDNGMWTNSPSLPFTYQWNVASGSPSTVFSQALTASVNGNQGYQNRMVIPAALLTATGTVSGTIRVGFVITAGTAAGTMAVDIGEQGTGNPWNFDGTQVPLTFGGAATLNNLNGAQTVFSDYVPFTLNASKALVIAFFNGGTTVNLGITPAGTTPTINTYYSNTVLDQTATAPAGLLTSAGFLAGVTEIDFISGTGTNTPIAGATAQTYTPINSQVGSPLNVSVTAANSGGSSLPATSLNTSPVIPAAGIPTNTAIPKIFGTPQVNQILSTDNGSWTNSPTGFDYAWNGAGTPTNASTYVPVTGDIGNQIVLSMDAKNAAGTSAIVMSLPTNNISPSGPLANRTANLLGILGISGHVGSYADNSQTVNDASFLGIGLWRDGISGNGTATNAIYQGFVNIGISIIGLPWLPTDQTYPGNIAGAKAILAMGPTPQGTRSLYAVEGPNEPTLSPFTYPDGSNSLNNWSGVSTWQKGWYAAVLADPTLSNTALPGGRVLVSTPTLVGAEPNNWGLQFLTVPTPAPGGELAAAGTKYADIYNYHLYPMYTGHCQTISPGFDAITNQVSADFVSTFAHTFAGQPLATVQASTRIITEFGYNIATAQGGGITPGGIVVDVPTQGKNMLTGLMNAWVEGLSGLCIYTLYPFGNPPDGNQIYNGPGNPKVSATYIHNFTSPLKDLAANAKTFSTGSLSYTLSGVPSTGKSLLFQKSNGNYELIIWNNVENWNNAAGAPITIGATTVTLTLSTAVMTLNVYDPTVQATPINSATTNVTTITASLRDYPIIIEVIPNTGPTMAPVNVTLPVISPG